MGHNFPNLWLAGRDDIMDVMNHLELPWYSQLKTVKAGIEAIRDLKRRTKNDVTLLVPRSHGRYGDR